MDEQPLKYQLYIMLFFVCVLLFVLESVLETNDTCLFGVHFTFATLPKTSHAHFDLHEFGMAQ